VIWLLLAIAGCDARPRTAPVRATLDEVTVRGSASLMPLLTEAANEFMRAHPKVMVMVAPESEDAAEKAVIDGTSSVAATSQPGSLKLEERTVGAVSIAVVANRGAHNDAVSGLTRAQLADVLRGRITNWKQLGGRDERIVVIDHERGSGARVAVLRWLGLENIEAPDADVVTAWTVQTATLARLGSLSFVAQPYLHPALKVLAIDGVTPSAPLLEAGQYPLFTEERLLLRRDATPSVRAFASFLQSPAVQDELLDQLGYVGRAKMPRQ
jgi:phosphate transport system substrate-binding protein